MCVRVCVCVPAHLTAYRFCEPVRICAFANKDLEPRPSIPGSQSLSIITFNDLHMGPSSAGYIYIPYQLTVM